LQVIISAAATVRALAAARRIEVRQMQSHARQGQASVPTGSVPSRQIQRMEACYETQGIASPRRRGTDDRRHRARARAGLWLGPGLGPRVGSRHGTGDDGPGMGPKPRLVAGYGPGDDESDDAGLWGGQGMGPGM